MRNISLLNLSLVVVLLAGCSEGALKLDSIATLSVDTVTGDLAFGTEETTITVSGGVAPYTFTTDSSPKQDDLENWSKIAFNQFTFQRPWVLGTTTLRVTDVLGNTQSSLLNLTPGGFNFVGGRTNNDITKSETIATQVLEDANGDFIICGTTTGIVETPDPDNPDKAYGTRDVFVAKILKNGTRSWIRQLEVGARSESGFDPITGVGGTMIALSSAGDIYLVGSSDGNFGGPEEGALNVFLAKYSTDGVLVELIAFGAGNGSTTYPVQVKTNSTGDVYIAGATQCGFPCANISMVAGEAVLTKQEVASGIAGVSGVTDTFIAKYSNGSDKIVWITELSDGAEFSVIPKQMLVDSNAVYVVGSTTNNTDTSFLVDEPAPLALGAQSAFHAKFFADDSSSDGSKDWVYKQGAGVGSTTPTHIAVDASGIYVVGRTTGRIGIAEIGDLGLGGEDTYISKYALTGEATLLTAALIPWSFQIGGGSAINAQTVPTHMQLTDDGVVIMGTTNGVVKSTILLAHGVGDAYMVNILNSGTLGWYNQLGGGGASETNPVRMQIVENPSAPDPDPTNGIYVAGTTSGIVSAELPLGGDGLVDAYLIKYSLAGALLWQKQLGATSATITTTTALTDFFVDSLGNSFLLGNFDSKKTIDGAFNLEGSIGEKNSYFVKVNSDGEMQ